MSKVPARTTRDLIAEAKDNRLMADVYASYSRTTDLMEQYGDEMLEGAMEHGTADEIADCSKFLKLVMAFKASGKPYRLPYGAWTCMDEAASELHRLKLAQKMFVARRRTVRTTLKKTLAELGKTLSDDEFKERLHTALMADDEFISIGLNTPPPSVVRTAETTLRSWMKTVEGLRKSCARVRALDANGMPQVEHLCHWLFRASDTLDERVRRLKLMATTESRAQDPVPVLEVVGNYRAWVRAGLPGDEHADALLDAFLTSI